MKTYILYLRSAVFDHPPLVHAHNTEKPTIEEAMAFIETAYGKDGLTRTPLEMFTGTKDACRERMEMFAALNDAKVVKDFV